MQEAGRERPPAGALGSGPAPSAGGSLTPRQPVQVVRTVVAVFFQNGRRHAIDQAAHARQAAREAPHQTRSREQRDPVRLRQFPRRIARVRAQSVDRYRACARQGIPSVACRAPGFIRASDAVAQPTRRRESPGGAARLSPIRRTTLRDRRAVGQIGMFRTVVQSRAPVALTLAAATGMWGLQTYPMSRDDVFLGLISEYAPGTYRLLAYGYATLWFTTPFWVASFAMSMLAILFYSRAPSARSRPLPPFPRSNGQSKLALVLGETHFHTAAGRAPNPT